MWVQYQDHAHLAALLIWSHVSTSIVHAQVNAAQGSSTVSSQDISDAAYRTSVEEGARDLAVVEALLESSRQGSQAVHVRDVPTKASS